MRNERLIPPRGETSEVVVLHLCPACGKCDPNCCEESHEYPEEDFTGVEFVRQSELDRLKADVEPVLRAAEVAVFNPAEMALDHLRNRVSAFRQQHPKDDDSRWLSTISTGSPRLQHPKGDKAA